MAAAPGRPDRLGLAVSAILVCVMALSLGDALVKGQADDYSLWQIFVLRSLIALPVLVAIIAASGRARCLVPVRAGWVVARSLLLVGNWVAYYASLPHLPLAVAAAAYYTLPLFIVLIAAAVERRPVSAATWLAVTMGFAGALLILRPGATSFAWASLLPLLAALLYALAVVMTRERCREEDALSLAAALHLGFLGAGALALLVLPSDTGGFLAGAWTSMDALGWQVMTVLAAAILIGSVGTAVAYQNGPPAVIGILDFTYLAFALLWGWLLHGETMQLAGWVGIGLIVLAGALALRRAPA